MAFKNIFDETRDKLNNYFGLGKPGLGTFGSQVNSFAQSARPKLQQVARPLIQKNINTTRAVGNFADRNIGKAISAINTSAQRDQQRMDRVSPMIRKVTNIGPQVGLNVARDFVARPFARAVGESVNTIRGKGFTPTSNTAKLAFGQNKVTTLPERYQANRQAIQSNKFLPIKNPTLATGLGLAATGLAFAGDITPISGGGAKTKLAKTLTKVDDIAKVKKLTGLSDDVARVVAKSKNPVEIERILKRSVKGADALSNEAKKIIIPQNGKAKFNLGDLTDTSTLPELNNMKVRFSPRRGQLLNGANGGVIGNDIILADDLIEKIPNKTEFNKLNGLFKKEESRLVNLEETRPLTREDTLEYYAIKEKLDGLKSSPGAEIKLTDDAKRTLAHEVEHIRQRITGKVGNTNPDNMANLSKEFGGNAYIETPSEIAARNAGEAALSPQSTQGASKAKNLDRRLPQQAIETTTKLEQTPKPLQVSKEGVSPNLAIYPKDVSFAKNVPQSAENVNIDPVQKIMAALKEAKPLSQEQKGLTSKLRSQQFAKMMSARGKTSGEQGFYSELGALKGGAKKVDFEAIRPNLEQADIDGLFDRVNDANIGEWEKINAKSSLAKLLSGEGVTIPTQNELKLLNDVFGSEFTKAILDKRSNWQKLMAGAGEVLNLPRSLMASFDLSAPLRQGVFMVGRPKQWVPAFFDMFKQFGSEKAYKAVQDSIQAKPNYKIMRQARLAITDVGDMASGREEQFMSNLAEKIPVIGKGVRASGRAYTGFLNKLRADVFDDLYGKAVSLGQDSPEMADDIAKFVNSATGRGDLGKLNNAATALNSVFFSPRLMASRVNLLNPAYYAQLNPMVRKEALKSLLTFGAVAGTALGIAKAGGAEVGTDPRSADFGKIKVGDTRYDILGGFQQYIVLASRLISGKMVSSTTGKEISLTEGYKPTTRKDIIINFLQSKENPILSYLTNFAEGTTQLGQQFKPAPELVDRMIPMLAQDLVELAEDKGFAKATGMTLPAFFGTGVQTYGKQIANLNEKGKLEWRNPPSIGERLVNKVIGQQASNIPADQQKTLSDQRRIELQNKADVDTAKAAIMKQKDGVRQVGDKVIFWDEENEQIKTVTKQKYNLMEFEKENGESAYNKAKWELDKQRYKASNNLTEYMKSAGERAEYLEKYIAMLDPKSADYLQAINSYEDLITETQKYASQSGFKKGKKAKVPTLKASDYSGSKIPIRSAKKPTFSIPKISSPKIAIKPKSISKSYLASIK